jgi:hypothetical protein
VFNHGESGVPQVLLKQEDITTIKQKVRGVGMSQQMRVQAL